MVLFCEMRSARSPRRHCDDKKPAAYKSSPLMRRARQTERTLRLPRQRTDKEHVPDDDMPDNDVKADEVHIEQWMVVSPLQYLPHSLHATPCDSSGLEPSDIPSLLQKLKWTDQNYFVSV